MNTYKCLNVNVSKTKLNNCIDFFYDNIDKSKDNYICCANAHTTVYAYEHENYRKIMNNAFLVLPDGGPVAKQGGNEVEKISGVDFLEIFLKDDKELNHFFYGNTKENLMKFISVVKKEYPNINIVGYKESVFRELNDIEKEELKNEVTKSNADIVWVALGAPKQEVFCAEMCENTNACWIAVGGAFNVVANIIPRAPLWMQKHSLEWLYRFIKEPKRLFKRYFIGNAKFIIYNIIYKWKKES